MGSTPYPDSADRIRPAAESRGAANAVRAGSEAETGSTAAGSAQPVKAAATPLFLYDRGIPSGGVLTFAPFGIPLILAFGLALATADFAYVRLHGPGGAYQGSYSEESMERWAAQIREWRKMLRAVYVYFDNDQASYAVENALTLKRLLG